MCNKEDSNIRARLESEIEYLKLKLEQSEDEVFRLKLAIENAISILGNVTGDSE